MLYPHTVATVTLTSGAPKISDKESTLTDPYSYKGLEGIFAVGDESLGGAQIAVQLDDTTVLSVEGFASVSNADDETVAKLGLFPLTSRLVDAWTQNKVPVNPEGSFFAAGDLCADVDLKSWEERLDLPEGDVVGRYSQSGREINTSDGEIGSIVCGTFGYASAAREADSWPWNEPESFGHPSVSFTATEFPDDSTASAYAARYSTSTDCSGAVAVGSPALMCEDGSGMASCCGAAGAWVSLSGISLEPTDADALAVAMDETSEQMLALAGKPPELSTDDVVDPRDVPIVSSSTPPDGATCPDNSDPAGVQATEHATTMICTDPDTGASTWSGDVDGVEFTLDGTCGPIDASKWDGPADATVCQEYNAISVLDVQNVPTTYFREYFSAKWSTDQFEGG